MRPIDAYEAKRMIDQSDLKSSQKLALLSVISSCKTAKAESLMSWIKVTDRLPPDMEPVLVSIETWDNKNRYVWPSKVRRRNGKFEAYMSDGFASGWDSGAFYDREVTHWMKWPEPAED